MKWKEVVRKFGFKGLTIFAVLLGASMALLGLNLSVSTWVQAILLGIGLLKSTFDIELKGLSRQDWKLILQAITIGVTLKAIFVAAVMVWAWGDPKYFVLAVAVSQVDPLAASVLNSHSRLSQKGKDILAAWSSFDDPVSILLTILMLTTQHSIGIDFGLTNVNVLINSMTGFGEYFVKNFAFMAAAVFLFERAYRGSYFWKVVFTITFLGGAIFIGATWYWMFGLALIGLYMRPKDKRVMALAKRTLDILAQAAFIVAVLLVCYLIAHEGRVDFGPGVALGSLAFVSHIGVTFLLVGRKPIDPQDRVYLAFSHQNGITATMLLDRFYHIAKKPAA